MNVALTYQRFSAAQQRRVRELMNRTLAASKRQRVPMPQPELDRLFFDTVFMVAAELDAGVEGYREAEPALRSYPQYSAPVKQTDV